MLIAAAAFWFGYEVLHWQMFTPLRASHNRLETANQDLRASLRKQSGEGHAAAADIRDRPAGKRRSLGEHVHAVRAPEIDRHRSDSEGSGSMVGGVSERGVSSSPVPGGRTGCVHAISRSPLAYGRG